MKNYVKPVVLGNSEMSEGVYAASGSCYTVRAEIKQWPAEGRGDYRIQLDADHDAADNHHSMVRKIQITFNMPVEFSYCNEASACTGSGSNTLVLTFSHHNNGYEPGIGLGGLVVIAESGLAINSVQCTYCEPSCDQGHTW